MTISKAGTTAAAIAPSILCGAAWAGGTWATLRILRSGEVGHFVYRHVEEFDSFTWPERWVSLNALNSWSAILLVGTVGALAGLVAYRMRARIALYGAIALPIVVSLVAAVLDRLYGHPPIPSAVAIQSTAFFVLSGKRGRTWPDSQPSNQRVQAPDSRVTARAYCGTVRATRPAPDARR